MSDTFEFHGESYTYADAFPQFEYAEFCEAMDEGVESNSAHATAATLRLALASLVETDQGRFRRACRKHRVDTEGYLKVFRDFLEIVAERPTQQPTDSSDGRDSDQESSGSQPAASVTSLPARPDLALASSRSA